MAGNGKKIATFDWLSEFTSKIHHDGLKILTKFKLVCKLHLLIKIQQAAIEYFGLLD